MKIYVVIIVLGGLLSLTACGPQAPLPTVAAPALHPPTPPVIVPTPTAAALTEARETAVLQPTPSGAAVSSPTPVPAAATPDIAPTGADSAPEPACDMPGGIEAGEFTSAVANGPMRYRIYLPPCYGQDGSVYPTLYLFGGNIHDETFWDRLGIDELAGAAILSGDIPPLLIVMPDNGWLANTTTSGPASYEGFVLNELIPHIEERYCAWSSREGRAVGGISRGGYWSLMMAFRRPDAFRSVGAHSPALIDSFAGPAEDPRVTGTTNALGDLRVWIDIGERDPYLVEARPLHEALSVAGVSHEWRVAPGIHDEAFWTAHLRDYLAWYSAGFPTGRLSLPDC